MMLQYMVLFSQSADSTTEVALTRWEVHSGNEKDAM